MGGGGGGGDRETDRQTERPTETQREKERGIETETKTDRMREKRKTAGTFAHARACDLRHTLSDRDQCPADLLGLSWGR